MPPVPAPRTRRAQPQYCGSCWLHGTVSMIQDRLKIVKNATGPDVMLGRQSLLNCAAFHGWVLPWAAEAHCSTAAGAGWVPEPPRGVLLQVREGLRRR